MGIRIHKFAGYGLSDVKNKSGRIDDPRVNADAPILDLESEEMPNAEGYYEFLKAKVEEQKKTSDFRMFNSDFYFLDNLSSFRDAPWLENCIHNGDSKTQTEGLLILQPISMSRQWSRNDDDLDYLEAVDSGNIENLKTKIIKPSTAIGGSAGLWMDETGERLSTERAHFWNMIQKETFENFDPEDSSGNVLAKAAGFKNWEEGYNSVAPYVPEEVRLLAEYTGIFTTPDVVLELRPIYCSYWG